MRSLPSPWGPVDEAIAAVDPAGWLARQNDALGADIVLGARALNQLGRRWYGPDSDVNPVLASS